MRSVLLISILAAVALPGALAADQKIPPARELRVAMVDLTRVFDEYEASKDLMQDLAELLRESRGKLERAQREIAMLRQSVQEYAMGTPERQAQEEKLEEKTRVARMLSMELQTSEDSLRSKMLMKIYLDADEAIQEYSRSHDIDLVVKQQSLREYDAEKLEKTPPTSLILDISRRSVLFAKPELDITDSIVEEMNAAHRRRNAEPEED